MNSIKTCFVKSCLNQRPSPQRPTTEPRTVPFVQFPSGSLLPVWAVWVSAATIWRVTVTCFVCQNVLQAVCHLGEKPLKGLIHVLKNNPYTDKQHFTDVCTYGFMLYLNLHLPFLYMLPGQHICMFLRVDGIAKWKIMSLNTFSPLVIPQLNCLRSLRRRRHYTWLWSMLVEVSPTGWELDMGSHYCGFLPWSHVGLLFFPVSVLHSGSVFHISSGVKELWGDLSACALVMWFLSRASPATLPAP